MKCSIGKETAAVPLTGLAPDAAVRTTQWVVDRWFPPGCLGIDALRRHGPGLRRQEVLRDAGRLGVQIRWMSGRPVIDQPAAADNDESDDNKQ